MLSTLRSIPWMCYNGFFVLFRSRKRNVHRKGDSVHYVCDYVYHPFFLFTYILSNTDSSVWTCIHINQYRTLLSSYNKSSSMLIILQGYVNVTYVIPKTCKIVINNYVLTYIYPLLTPPSSGRTFPESEKYTVP